MHIRFSTIEFLCKLIETKSLIINVTKSISPFAFPLLIEQLSSQVSNEDIQDRLDYLLKRVQ